MCTAMCPEVYGNVYVGITMKSLLITYIYILCTGVYG